MSNVIPFHYQGSPVQFNTDGWINATSVSKRFGKRPNDWLELPSTSEYLESLARHLNTGESGNLTRTARGRNGGTWLHPKLAVVFARWLSADFAVWCDMRIDALLHGDLDARRQFDQACKALAEGRDKASLGGKELAKWRWQKPGLERRADYWRDQLQMTLGLEVA